MPLVASLKTGGTVQIGPEVHLKIGGIRRGRVRLVISAPRNLKIVWVDKPAPPSDEQAGLEEPMESG